MTAPLLVTGGTGTLGRLVVPRLRAAGQQVRVLSRGRHEPGAGLEYAVGDLTTGAGVADALQGIGTVLHLAGSAKGDGEKADTLVRAATRAGVRQLVYISVVGAERIPVVGGIARAMFGYFVAKRSAEEIIAASGLPWTTLRATQFHDLTLTTVRGMARLPLVPVPSGFRFQPIDAGEVADRLVALALGSPSGLVPDIAGPQIYALTELVRSYLRATGRQRPLLSIRLPGKAAGAIRAGANLAPDRASGRRTWEDFLRERVR